MAPNREPRTPYSWSTSHGTRGTRSNAFPRPTRYMWTGWVYSTARTKTALLPLKPRLDYQPDSPLQQPGIGFPGEAEECDPLVLLAHPPVGLAPEWGPGST
ncbi:hypothetical protein XENORESO_007265 [Xenotaenia resolanae]|uniref:Uncharacterized protein n=1 Tax=Xenotaenia resolanae TaxID=208358 RepID=A0ABV0W856_9TELE